MARGSSSETGRWQGGAAQRLVGGKGEQLGGWLSSFVAGRWQGGVAWWLVGGKGEQLSGW